MHIYLSDRLFVAMTKRLGVSRRRLRRLQESQRLSAKRGVSVSLFSTARLLGWISDEQAQWLLVEGQHVAAHRPQYANDVVVLSQEPEAFSEEPDSDWVPDDAIEELEELDPDQLPHGLMPVAVEASWEPERFSQEDDLLTLDEEEVAVSYGPSTEQRYDFASSSERRSPFLVTASDEAFSVTPSDLSPPQVDDLLHLLDDLPEQPLEEQELLQLFDQASEPAAPPLPLEATWDAKPSPLAAGAADPLAADPFAAVADDPFAAAARATSSDPVDPFAAAARAWQPAHEDPFARPGQPDPLLELLEGSADDPAPADSALFEVDWGGIEQDGWAQGMESGLGTQPAFL